MAHHRKPSKETHPGQRRRLRSPSAMSGVGRALEILRLDRHETLTEFARSAGLSHAVLSAISYGKKKLTPYVLDKLKNNLELRDAEIERLQKAEEHERQLSQAGDVRDDLLPYTIPVTAERLIRREAREDVIEARVVDPAPQEEFDSAWRGKVVSNLVRSCKYTYFTMSRRKAETVKLSLHQALEARGKGPTDVNLQFVVVPEPLLPHFFNPIRVLYQLDSLEVIGFWSFRGRPTPSEGLVMRMDQETADGLWAEYGCILNRLQKAPVVRPGERRSQLADDQIEFVLLEGEKKADGAAQRAS